MDALSQSSGSGSASTGRRLLPKSAPIAFHRRRPIRNTKHRPLPQKRSQNPYSGCYVMKCRRKNCTLLTHNHVGGIMDFEAACVKGVSANPEDRVDLLRNLLPIPRFSDPVVDDEEFRNLFHQYLAFDMPRIVALMFPPSSTIIPVAVTKTKQQAIAHLGLLEPVYFMLFVSMAHILELVRRESLQPDKVSARIYGRLMHVLREKLVNYKPSEASNVALCVLALSSFDMSLGNYAVVESHHLALKQLVTQAGLPYIGNALAYVVSWDRLMAAFTAKASLYAKMPDRQFLRPPKYPKKYGMGLELAKYNLCLDVDVENLCDDVCRAIEIADAENWTFRPERLSKPYNAAEVQYLFYARDVIQNTCIILQVRDLYNADKSRPLVFAAMIVQYLVLGKNELPWYSTAAADRLYETLMRQDLEEVWQDSEEVLCWLMCLMVIVKPWRHRPLALKLFRDWVEKKVMINNIVSTRGAWDSLCSPMDFLWSSPDFDERLSEALKDYESSGTVVKVIERYDPLAPGSKMMMVSCSIRESSDEEASSPETE